MRQHPLVNNEIYHCTNKSIAGYKIFSSKEEYERMQNMMRFFSIDGPMPKFSQFLEMEWVKSNGILASIKELEINQSKIVQIVAFCLMSTHIHLLLKQTAPNGITDFMKKVLNSYTRYFNIKHKRKGPLWVGRFKSVLIKTDEQFLHTIRYLHLNPTSSALVNKPEDWSFSSYKEYLDEQEDICQYKDIMPMTSQEIRKFTEENQAHQRSLEILKH